MKKLFYNFCVGCIIAFTTLLAGRLISCIIRIDQIGQLFDCFMTTTKDLAVLDAPIMLFCGALYAVIFSHDGSEKKEGTESHS